MQRKARCTPRQMAVSHQHGANGVTAVQVLKSDWLHRELADTDGCTDGDGTLTRGATPPKKDVA
jgi:hypothetical protein